MEAPHYQRFIQFKLRIMQRLNCVSSYKSIVSISRRLPLLGGRFPPATQLLRRRPRCYASGPAATPATRVLRRRPRYYTRTRRSYAREWMARPLRSFGSNQVVFGGMMLPVSAMRMSWSMDTG